MGGRDTYKNCRSKIIVSRSRKLQIELLIRGLEGLAAKLLGHAKEFKDSGHLDFSEQAALQARDLSKAIDQLRALELD